MPQDIKSTNITWHHGQVTREDREKLGGHKAAVIWFTGLSGSGKSTIAHKLEGALYEMGCRTIVLDGDNIRHGLNKNLGFSPEDRKENIRRIGEVAKLFVDAGVIAMTAFISPYREDRDQAREIAGEDFIEVYVKAPVAICEERDPKGLYKKARAGEIKEFTGVSAPYEEPDKAEIVLDTSESNVEECVDMVLQYLQKRNILPREMSKV